MRIEKIRAWSLSRSHVGSMAYSAVTARPWPQPRSCLRAKRRRGRACRRSEQGRSLRARPRAGSDLAPHRRLRWTDAWNRPFSRNGPFGAERAQHGDAARRRHRARCASLGRRRNFSARPARCRAAAGRLGSIPRSYSAKSPLTVQPLWPHQGFRHSAALRHGGNDRHVPSRHRACARWGRKWKRVLGLRTAVAAAEGQALCARTPNRLQHYYEYHDANSSGKPSGALCRFVARRSASTWKLHDVRFVEDDWESPTLRRVSWECWCDGMEVSQFTYFGTVAGFDARPLSGDWPPPRASWQYSDPASEQHLRHRLQRPKRHRASLARRVRAEKKELSRFDFEHADTANILPRFRDAEADAARCWSAAPPQAPPDGAACLQGPESSRRATSCRCFSTHAG